MKRLIYWCNFLYLFSLSLWVSGMFLLGILVEVIVRIKLREQPEIASAVMNKIMDIFNVRIIYTCIAVILVTEAIKFCVGRYGSIGFREPVFTKKRHSREVALVIMIALALYIGSVLRPQMHNMDQQKKADPANQKLQIQFDRYHSRLTWVYSVNMILGMSLFYIRGREMPRFRHEPHDAKP